MRRIALTFVVRHIVPFNIAYAKYKSLTKSNIENKLVPFIFCASLIFTLLLQIDTYAQKNPCKDYNVKNCLDPQADGFQVFGQSRNALLAPEQVSEMKVVVYKGYDYYVSVCTCKAFRPLHFRIFELEAGGTRKQLYDNAEFDNIEEVLFTNSQTRNIIIEVTVPRNAKNDDANLDAKDFTRECVGVLMMWRRTPRTGF